MHPRRYFDDFEVGFSFETGRFKMERDYVVGFASEYDPQGFHLEDEAGESSFFGRMVGSGWQTAAVTHKMIVATGVFEATGMIAFEIDELRFPRPMLPGDVLQARGEIVGKQPSRSGRRGSLKVAVATHNQAGELVLSFIATLIVQGRPQPA